MSLPVPATGFGTISKLQGDGILAKIFEVTVRPLKSVDLQAFPGRIRAVLTPVLNTDILHVSQGFTAAVTQAVENAIASDGAILRLTISCLVTDVMLLDENIPLTTVNSIDWTRFTEISFEYPRTQACIIAKPFLLDTKPDEFHIYHHEFHPAQVLTPDSRYPTMPILEFVRDKFYLTINVMKASEYHLHHSCFRPEVKDPKPCVNRHSGCKCSVAKIRPIRIRTGISGPITNFLAPRTGNPPGLDVIELLSLPRWESGCN
ncbi:hypothetical protein BKA64DRAFT_338203 [Cadophora sp. MPI-SDFR-AT-0126]|nr:hypothetical protein BKA64DRAFT_338203 [Leotiomycetes sp. MPI-SDFR-AT-0126]